MSAFSESLVELHALRERCRRLEQERDDAMGPTIQADAKRLDWLASRVTLSHESAESPPKTWAWTIQFDGPFMLRDIRAAIDIQIQIEAALFRDGVDVRRCEDWPTCTSCGR